MPRYHNVNARPESYEKLKKRAEQNNRTITAEFDQVIKAMTKDEAKFLLSQITTMENTILAKKRNNTCKNRFKDSKRYRGDVSNFEHSSKQSKENFRGRNYHKMKKNEIGSAKSQISKDFNLSLQCNNKNISHYSRHDPPKLCLNCVFGGYA